MQVKQEKARTEGRAEGRAEVRREIAIRLTETLRNQRFFALQYTQ